MPAIDMLWLIAAAQQERKAMSVVAKICLRMSDEFETSVQPEDLQIVQHEYDCTRFMVRFMPMVEVAPDMDGQSRTYPNPSSQAREDREGYVMKEFDDEAELEEQVIFAAWPPTYLNGRIVCE